ncbi:MAG TPA: NAD(P)H-binding protein [Nitrospiria bacterium]|nr:NAD(P)H-binding protein [Nitrospiria bacterium]
MFSKSSPIGKKPRVLVLGFGRLGRAFYRLFGRQYEIRGIRRNPDPRDPANITRMAIQSEALVPLLDWAEVVVFCPSSGGGELDIYKQTYLENIRFTIDKIQKQAISIRQFVLIGSTGVYPKNRGGVWTEQAVIPDESPRQEILNATEKVLIESGLNFAILRCGGIYGEGRGNFGRILKAGRILSSEMTEQFYPLINQEDICGAISRVIESGGGGIFNLVDDSGLTRKQLFNWISENAGIPIEKDGTAPELPGRSIPNEKLKRELGLTFRSPTVTDFLEKRPGFGN